MNPQTQDLLDRTLRFAVDAIAFAETLPPTTAGRTIGGQLIRSSSSIGANFREAQRARTRAEFVSKIQISLQEASEAEYWMQITLQSKLGRADGAERLQGEAKQLVAILAAITRTTKFRQGPR